MKLRLIANLITLVVTTFLLIFVVMAWYVSNDNTSARGVIGATAEGKSLYMSSTFIPTENQKTVTELDSNIWKMNLDINTNSLLLPVSTNDAINYYYTPDINEDGTAIDTDGDYNFVKVTTSKSFYYLEKELYFIVADASDTRCSLKNISINQGSDESSNIFKSVRVYFEDADDSRYNNMFKYHEENAVYPAVSETSVALTDPAISDGIQSPDKFNFRLSGSYKVEDVTTYTFKKIIIRVWVEGQDPNAVATYAGTGFTINLAFATYN